LRLSPNTLGHSTAGTTSHSTVDLRQVKTPHPVLHADVLLDGSLIDLETNAFPNVTAASRLTSGSSVVIVPGDRFLGGPACGIVLGSKSCLTPLREIARKQRLEVQPLLACILQWVLVKQSDKLAWQQQPVGATAFQWSGKFERPRETT
jgi:L-seryl-tRNA(Ser) seleniumtransferase